MNVNPDAKFGKRECPSCACEVPVNENRCPICGYEFASLPGRQSFRLWAALTLLGILLALLLGLLR